MEKFCYERCPELYAIAGLLVKEFPQLRALGQSSLPSEIARSWLDKGEDDKNALLEIEGEEVDLPPRWLRLYLFREALSCSHPEYCNKKQSKWKADGKPVRTKLTIWIGAQVVHSDHFSADHSCWYPDGYHGTRLVTIIMIIQDGGHFKQVSLDGALNRARASDDKPATITGP